MKRKLKKPFRIALSIVKYSIFGALALTLMMWIFFGAVLQTSERIEYCGYGQICEPS